MKIENIYTMKQPEFVKKIFELRKAKGITQEELVEKCNINVRTIRRIEVMTLGAIQLAFGIALLKLQKTIGNIAFSSRNFRNTHRSIIFKCNFSFSRINNVFTCNIIRGYYSI